MENEYRFNFKIECMEGHGKSICAKFQELFKQNNYRTISVEDYAFKTEPGKVVTVGALRGNFIQLLKTLDLVYGANVKSRSLYSLRHIYATFSLKSGRKFISSHYRWVLVWLCWRSSTTKCRLELTQLSMRALRREIS